MRWGEEELANMKAGVPVLETTGGRAGWSMSSAAQLSAFASCARQLGLPLDVVLRAAGTNMLGRLIEKRSRRNVERRNTARIEGLYRKKLLGLLLERDALLRRLEQ